MRFTPHQLDTISEMSEDGIENNGATIILYNNSEGGVSTIVTDNTVLCIN